MKTGLNNIFLLWRAGVLKTFYIREINYETESTDWYDRGQRGYCRAD